MHSAQFLQTLMREALMSQRLRRPPPTGRKFHQNRALPAMLHSRVRTLNNSDLFLEPIRTVTLNTIETQDPEINVLGDQ